MTTAPASILIVEDSPTQAELLRAILEDHKFDVTTAASGEEALEILTVKRPALVITDVMMPGIDGFELCRRMKRDPELKAIPLVLLTSLSDAKDIIRGLECGADNFVVKPFDDEYLISRVTFILLNRKLALSSQLQTGVEIRFLDQTYFITAERQQILNLLLSTYEAAVHKNLQLASAQNALRELNESLEAKIAERTRELSASETVLRAKAAELESANQSLRQFGYVTSHDLKEPLRMISCYLQLLEKRLPSDLSSENREALGFAVKGAQRMSAMLDDILLYSSLERAERSPQRALISEIAKDCAASFRDQVHITVGELPAIELDEIAVTRILNNLLANAVKFRENGRPLEIRLSARLVGTNCEIDVADNGIGIEAQYFDKIFVFFRRLHNKDVIPGTGAGLAICRRVVEQLGGRIWVKSSFGSGSVFSFSIPIDRETSGVRAEEQLPEALELR